MLNLWLNKLINIPDRILYFVLILLVIPAFLIYLGQTPFIGDEGIRALVALEMKLSGNYMVPTLNGEAYYNKPPLYNWILIAVSYLTGSLGEWTSRLTTLFFLALYALTVYKCTLKKIDRLTAVCAALMLITSGRILFWDSMLGLIDICFSWLIFLNFMIWYYLPLKAKWKQLFIISYLLIVAGFLLKGLPAVVFQGLTVISALLFHRQFRAKFISFAHVWGISIFLIICGSYYLIYAQYQSLELAFNILFDQSMQRTATHHTVSETILHFFSFPFEQIYHFLPWSLLLVAVFHPRFLQIVKSNPFVKYNAIILLVNLVIYWISVEVYPRYLLMFIPLFNLILYYVLFISEDQSKNLKNIFHWLLIGVSGISAILFWIFPLVERSRQLFYWPFIWIVGGTLLTIITVLLIKDQRRMVLWAAMVLLILRTGVDTIIFPFRTQDALTNQTRSDAYRTTQLFSDKDWYIYGETELHEVARFYTTNGLQKIIRKKYDVKDETAYYLVDLQVHPEFKGIALDSIRSEMGNYIMIMKVE